MDDTKCVKNVEKRKEAVDEREEASTDNNDESIQKQKCGAYQSNRNNEGVVKCSKLYY